MYRILIAVKRGKFEYENTYQWYSEKETIEKDGKTIETGKIIIKEFEKVSEAYDKVKELMKDPCPYKDYSYHDLVVVDYKGYDVFISGLSEDDLESI